MPQPQGEGPAGLDSDYLQESIQAFGALIGNLRAGATQEDALMAERLLREATDRFKGELALRGEIDRIPKPAAPEKGGRMIFQSGDRLSRVPPARR